MAQSYMTTFRFCRADLCLSHAIIITQVSDAASAYTLHAEHVNGTAGDALYSECACDLVIFYVLALCSISQYNQVGQPFATIDHDNTAAQCATTQSGC